MNRMRALANYPELIEFMDKSREDMKRFCESPNNFQAAKHGDHLWADLRKALEYIELFVEDTIEDYNSKVVEPAPIQKICNICGCTARNKNPENFQCPNCNECWHVIHQGVTS